MGLGITILETLHHLYPESECFVCRKPDAEDSFIKPMIRGFHKKCLQKVEPIDKSLTEKIKKLASNLFPDLRIMSCYFFKMRERMYQAVEIRCGETTIEIYLNKNGAEALKKLFDEVEEKVFNSHGLIDISGKIKSKL